MILLYYSLVHAIRIKRPRVQVLPWPLAGFVLGILEFKSSAMLVKQQNWFTSCQLGFLIMLCYIKIVYFIIAEKPHMYKGRGY